MRVAVYVRVSTDEQASSAEAQEFGALAWCAAQGHSVVATYSDIGHSGAEWKRRPGVIAMEATQAFAKKQGPFLRVAINWAASTQVKHWMGVLDEWKKMLGPDWDKAYGASNTIYVAETDEKAMREGMVIRDLRTSADITRAVLEIDQAYEDVSAKAMLPFPPRPWSSVAEETMALFSSMMHSRQ